MYYYVDVDIHAIGDVPQIGFPYPNGDDLYDRFKVFENWKQGDIPLSGIKLAPKAKFTDYMVGGSDRIFFTEVMFSKLQQFILDPFVYCKVAIEHKSVFRDYYMLSFLTNQEPPEAMKYIDFPKSPCVIWAVGVIPSYPLGVIRFQNLDEFWQLSHRYWTENKTGKDWEGPKSFSFHSIQLRSDIEKPDFLTIRRASIYPIVSQRLKETIEGTGFSGLVFKSMQGMGSPDDLRMTPVNIDNLPEFTIKNLPGIV